MTTMTKWQAALPLELGSTSTTLTMPLWEIDQYNEGPNFSTDSWNESMTSFSPIQSSETWLFEKAWNSRDRLVFPSNASAAGTEEPPLVPGPTVPRFARPWSFHRPLTGVAVDSWDCYDCLLGCFRGFPTARYLKFHDRFPRAAKLQ